MTLFCSTKFLKNMHYLAPHVLPTTAPKIGAGKLLAEHHTPSPAASKQLFSSA